MSTPTTQASQPTRGQYNCGSGCGQITFKWTKPMPKGGYLGEVTIGQYVNKPIQVFDPKPITGGGTDWQFQAQDGEFLGHMYVSRLKSFIRFANFRPGDKFPQVTCVTPRPEPGDDRDPIDKIP